MMIREASINDIESINKLGCQYNENFTKTYNMLKEIKSNLAIILIFESNGIKGFLYALDFGDNLDIMYIVVDEMHRGKKIAFRLLDYFLVNYVQESTVTLEVSTNNYPAISLYKKFGFKQIKIRKKYYANGDDAILMRRER